MADFDNEDERVEELNTLQSIYPELTLDVSDAAAPSASIELLTAPAQPLPVAFGDDETLERLSYLPPLLLEIILAEGYPAEQPPTLRLSTSPSWLSDTILRQLEAHGHTLWEEYGGMQMLFAYISYLQEASEDAYGIVRNREGGVVKLPTDLKPTLLELNKRLKKEIFEKETFDCGVCLEPKKGAACYRMLRCSHVFCVSCLQDFYGNCIKEGNVNGVKCMSPDCGKTGDVSVDRRRKERLVSPKQLLQIPLPLETVQRFVNLKRKKKMEADSSIVFCPRRWCQGAMRTKKYPKITDVSELDESDVEFEDAPQTAEEKTAKAEADKNAPNPGAPHTDRVVICEDCNLAFCKVCLKPWHGDFIRCRDPEGEKKLTEEEEASLNYILKHTTPCPECNVPCQKSHGCNHMTCFQCKSHFCYLCSAWLDAGNPYNHFNYERLHNKKKNPCFRRLFDGVEGDQGNDAIQFQGARGAEQQAEFWEREVLRMQMEELDAS